MAIKLWDVRKTVLVNELEGHEKTPPGVVLVNELEGHEKMPTGVVFAPDGHVYSCSEDGTVRVWDAKKGKKVRAWRAH
ncbi:hypothetical protein T484DRAFT_1764498 [Baffinella frigidus]|nr:hypothetical protein T484DRAFT_1764498 [Cryptophyta sp. CCMP2293]